MTREEVAQAVASLCAPYGTVQNVGIIPAQGPFFKSACVEMSSLPETLEILRQFGGEKILSTVVIELGQA